MSANRKYDVVAVDMTTAAEEEKIAWLAISAASQKLCPYIALNSPMYNRLSALHLIRKDLEFAIAALEKLKELGNEGIYDVVKQSLWYSAVVSYAKCFTQAEGRRVRLHAKQVFKDVDKSLIESHEEIMHQRHEYISHAGDTTFEQADTMLALSPDLDKKEIFGFYHSMSLILGIRQPTIDFYICLVKHVHTYIERALDKAFPAALNEVGKTSVGEWYEKATYPLENIPARALETNLEAPSGEAVYEIFVKVEIKPPNASVLIYGAPGYDNPVRFDGPVTEGAIKATEPKIYFQRINGAKQVTISTLGYRDTRK
ncbi:MAG: hypothetical protein O6826_05885 [Acidobacteria bacterium]|nr:hypothetical protein [Acidobacteriota bacterium]